MSNKSHEQVPFRIGPKTMFQMDGKTQALIVAAAVAITTWCLHVNSGLADHAKMLEAHTVTLGQIQKLQETDDRKLNALMDNKAGLSPTTEAVAQSTP